MRDEEAKDMPAPDGGFTLEWEREVGYLGLRAVCCRHRCGLQVISLECADVENAFIAGFRTPGSDDTGVQHILEHVVLGGSRHCPVKNPCEELSRGSLATYINAETYRDRTLYPFTSISEEDFANGVGVYLDAVFSPLLLEETFLQEGWRYELTGEGAPRTTGIVLNECRAERDEVGGVALSAAYRELFPGHPLSWDTGGVPGVIETLRYEDMVDYYRRWYRLPQARLLFYGNIPTGRKLALVDGYLRRHCAERLREVCLPEERPRPAPASWQSPRRVTVPVACEPGDDGASQCAWSLNWHLGQLAGPAELLGMELLETLLLEDDGSPLSRTLLESGLCENLLDCTGMETDCAECLLVVGVVNCRRESFDELRTLCVDCLERCRRDGFSPEQVQAALNQLRLRYEAVSNGHALALGQQVMRNWLSGQDPLAGVDHRACLAALREELARDGRFLERLLERLLLDNRHRVELRLVADPGLAARRQAEEERRCQRQFARLSAAERAAWADRLARFADFQARPDSSEALAAFPRLTRRQLPREPFSVDVAREVLPCGTVLLNCRQTSGAVNYAKLAFDVSSLPPEELEVLPTFACLLEAVGVSGCRYGDFERRLGLAGAEIDVGVHYAPAGVSEMRPRAALTLRLAALSDHWEAALDCLMARWRDSQFTERARLRDTLRQCWAQGCQRLQSEDEALELAMWRSAAGICPREACTESWYGVLGMRRLREARRQLLGRGDALTALLVRMRDRLAQALPNIVSYAGDAAGHEALLRRLPRTGRVRAWQPLDWGSLPAGTEELGRRESLANGLREFCCVRSFGVCGYSDPLWAPLLVYAELLGEGYLLDQIRLAGGAYGCGCSYSPSTRLLQLYSYRDPSPRGTLEVFASVPGRAEPWTEAQLTGAIAGCLRNDVPLRASESCNAALVREMLRVSDDERRLRWQQLLDVTLRDVRWAAEAFREAAARGFNDCLVGDARTLGRLGCRTLSWRRAGD